MKNPKTNDTRASEDITLPAANGIPEISIPRLCPYCHEGLVGYGYDGYYNGYPMLSISCPVCESESTRDYDGDNEDPEEAHRAKFLLFNEYLRRISYLPPVMLLRPGDNVSFGDVQDVICNRGIIQEITHTDLGLMFKIECYSGRSRVRYYLGGHNVLPMSVDRVHALSHFIDRSLDAFPNLKD